MQTDPLAEKYYVISPYAVCAGNPVMFVDPDGRVFHKAKVGNVIFISATYYSDANSLASAKQAADFWNNRTDRYVDTNGEETVIKYSLSVSTIKPGLHVTYDNSYHVLSDSSFRTHTAGETKNKKDITVRESYSILRPSSTEGSTTGAHEIGHTLGMLEGEGIMHQVQDDNRTMTVSQESIGQILLEMNKYMSLTLLLTMSCARPNVDLVYQDELPSVICYQDTMVVKNPLFHYDQRSGQLFMESNRPDTVVFIDDISKNAILELSESLSISYSVSDSVATFMLKGMEKQATVYTYYEWDAPVGDDRIPAWFDNYEYTTDSGFRELHGVYYPRSQYCWSQINLMKNKMSSEKSLPWRMKWSVLMDILGSAFNETEKEYNYWFETDKVLIFEPLCSGDYYAVFPNLLSDCKDYLLFQLGYNCTSLRLTGDPTMHYELQELRECDCGKLYTIRGHEDTIPYRFRLGMVRDEESVISIACSFDDVIWQDVGDLKSCFPDEKINEFLTNKLH